MLKKLLPRPLRRLVRAGKDSMLNALDGLYRLLSGKWDSLPPYSLRMRVGGAKGFGEVGPMFLSEFRKFGIIRPGQSMLDVGCGCGRVTLTLASEQELGNSIRYVGMDVDEKAVKWCRDHITRRHPNFTFYQVDMYNSVYNPEGKVRAVDFRFPHTDDEFDLIFLASVFSNFAPDGLENYMRELHRIVKPDGVVYANFFTYQTKSEAVDGVDRRPYKYKFFHGHYAVVDEEHPEGAIAYERNFVLDLAAKAGLHLKTPIQEGFLETFIFGKK